MSISPVDRRTWLRGLFGGSAALGLSAAWGAKQSDAAQVAAKDTIKVTKIETFVLKNSWVFVKLSTDAGISGWGEMLKDDAKACAAGALEVGDYLIGQDPRRVVFHWQAIHRGAFYRGGPIKTAISSGIDQALWDITGKAYGVPVYKLMGGPTRDRVRVYGSPNPTNGVNAMKVQLRGSTRAPFKHNEGQKMVDEIIERFKALREKMGPGVDIGVEFHGAIQPPTAMVLMKALEPFNPWFYEEVVQALNIELMAELARKTHIPLATGERIFTKWGFKDILEKARRDDPATGRVLRRRHHGAQDHRRHGRGVLHAAGAAQPAGAMLAGGQPADCGVDPQLPHSGTWRQRVHRSARQAAAADRERASPAPDRAGPRHHDRREQADGAGRRTETLQPAVRYRRRIGCRLVGRT